MKKTTKSKAKAISRVPQNREDAVFAIGRIGTLQREIASHKAVADEAVRIAGEKLEADTASLTTELAEHERGVQMWCEANRNALTNDGKVKFHDFGTGQVKWRSLPASVSIRGMEAVIEAIKKLGFSKDFIRTKEEVSKEAMLADADKARLIVGVDLAPKFYPVLSSLQRFLVGVFGAVAAGCGAEPFRLRSTASRRGLMVWANSAGVSQPRPECGRCSL